MILTTCIVHACKRILWFLSAYLISDHNFMLCSEYLHSVNRTSRWHKSGQDINHLAGNMTQHARTADTGGDTVKDFQQCDIKTNRARSGAPVPALHHVPVCARPCVLEWCDQVKPPAGTPPLTPGHQDVGHSSCHQGVPIHCSNM